MSKGKVYISNYPDNPPEWYWISGLHDACIIGTESFDFPFDYNKFVGEKNIYNRNLITLRINANGALVDHGKYYTLEIDLQDFDAYPEEFSFKIKFERAEVDR